MFARDRWVLVQLVLAVLLLAMACYGYATVHYDAEFKHLGATCTVDLFGVTCRKI